MVKCFSKILNHLDGIHFNVFKAKLKKKQEFFIGKIKTLIAEVMSINLEPISCNLSFTDSMWVQSDLDFRKSDFLL